MISFRYPAKFDKQATILLTNKEQVEKQNFSISVKPIKDGILRVLEAKQFSGDSGEIFPLIVNKRVILLTGTGSKDKLSLTALHSNIKNALSSTYLKKIKDVEIVVPEDNSAIIKTVIEAALIGTYSWEKYKTLDAENHKTEKKHITITVDRKKEYEDTVCICGGVNLTRDLINDNADIITSVYIEKTVRNLIKGKKNIFLKVLNKLELERENLNLHLAVNRASKKEPKLIIVQYKGASTSAEYTALIGKGLTFDTGGLNLKPTGHMETMRQDMSGAAAVVGILKNTIAMNLNKNIIFVCAMAENSIGSESYKPGDVIRSYSGKTVEIGNTDAEGRLVLADAISYINKNYKPARIIDIATLTGACVVALGNDYTGLVTNDDKLSQKLCHAAEATDDRIWRLPLYPELKDAIKSQIADIRNTGFPKGSGGAITAAEFLHQFVGDTPWAHLDIAGTAFVENKQRMYFGYGATGASVRLLTNYLMNN